MSTPIEPEGDNLGASTARVGRRSDYRIALREDSLGLDDVVVNDVTMFRMERMDHDHVWLACYLGGDEDIVFDMWIEKGKIVYRARAPLPNVVYEAVEESSGTTTPAASPVSVSEVAAVSVPPEGEQG